jgi:hypothetical protein
MPLVDKAGEEIPTASPEVQKSQGMRWNLCLHQNLHYYWGTPEQLRQFFRSHHIIRKATIQRRTSQIQAAGTPLTQDEAIVVPAQALTQGLVALLKVVLMQLIEFEAQIATLFAALPDAKLFQALPGAGAH